MTRVVIIDDSGDSGQIPSLLLRYSSQGSGSLPRALTASQGRVTSDSPREESSDSPREESSDSPREELPSILLGKLPSILLGRVRSLLREEYAVS